jgi:hypothetical protein
VLLDAGDAIVPEEWKRPQEQNKSKNSTAWKKEGDAMFLKKRFREALIW